MGERFIYFETRAVVGDAAEGAFVFEPAAVEYKGGTPRRKPEHVRQVMCLVRRERDGGIADVFGW